jgi:hypothetical protein
MAEIEIEIDKAKVKKDNGGYAPDPTDPHYHPDLDYGWANLPPDIFGPEEHPFGSIGASRGSYIQNTTSTTITDFHIRVKKAGVTIKPNPAAGGSLFPNVTYDPDGKGVTFDGGGQIQPGEWFWMKMPGGTSADYEGHATPNKQAPGTGGGSGSRCFVVSAAYGSDAAEEVQFLRAFRDTVLRELAWGRTFFDEFERHYYRLSPPIARQMDEDPDLRRLVRWTIVQPWVNYLRLVLAQPDWEAVDATVLEPALEAFLATLRADMQAWLDEVEIPVDFERYDSDEAVRMLGLVLRYGKPAGAARFLEELIDAGCLPIAHDPADEPRLAALLEEAHCSQREVDAVLHGRRVVG